MTSPRSCPGQRPAPARTIEDHLAGVFAGLIAVVVIAALFMTAEYRRGLIRTTLAASPRRGRVLAAKAIVLGLVAFAAGLAASVIAVTVGVRLSRDQGQYVLPVTWPTEARVIVGTAALLAVAAVLAVAIGTVLRRSAVAVAAVVVAIVLPYVLAVAQVLPAGAGEWLLRVTPAAAFAIQQSIPHYAQVTAAVHPAGLLPAVPVGRVRGAVRLRRGRPGAGPVPAAQEGRMSRTLPARRASLPPPAPAAPAAGPACGARCTRSGRSSARHRRRCGC